PALGAGGDAADELARLLVPPDRVHRGRGGGVDELLEADREALREVEDTAERVDREPAADLELGSLSRRDVEAVDDAGAAAAGRELDELAVVVLLGPQVVGAEELAVVVVEARELRPRRDLAVASRLGAKREALSCAVRLGVARGRHLLAPLGE